MMLALLDHRVTARRCASRHPRQWRSDHQLGRARLRASSIALHNCTTCATSAQQGGLPMKRILSALGLAALCLALASVAVAANVAPSKWSEGVRETSGPLD